MNLKGAASPNMDIDSQSTGPQIYAHEGGGRGGLPKLEFHSREKNDIL